MKQKGLFREEAEVKERQEGKLKKMKLAKLADEWGRLADIMNRLKKQQEKLREQILKEVKPGEKIKGSKWEITVTEISKPVVDPAKVYEKLGKDLFLRVASVKIEALRKVTMPQEFEGLVENYVTSYRIDKKPVT